MVVHSILPQERERAERERKIKVSEYEYTFLFFFTDIETRLVKKLYEHKYVTELCDQIKNVNMSTEIKTQIPND